MPTRIAALLLAVIVLCPACGDDGGGGGGEPDAPSEPAADAAGVLPDTAPAADTAPGGDGAPRDGGGLMCGDKELYADCVEGTECSSCLCFTIDMRSYCSRSCTGDGDCPPPSPGCSLLSGGFCLPPE